MSIKKPNFTGLILKNICVVTVLMIFAPQLSVAKIEKPTLTAEDFYRFIRAKRYEDAADLLSRADQRSFKNLQQKMKKAGKKKKAEQYDLAKLLEDQFFLVHGQSNKKMLKKAGDGETILPEKIGYFVPGQYYIVGNYAVVFTRETYELAHEKTGPVRDDPRKLWIDPMNDLSKIRDEAYFKRWWEWDKDFLSMPGVLWLVKERNEWRVDLISGTVPKKAFRGILKWHFGRDIFEETKTTKKEQGNEKAGEPPAGKNAVK